MTDRHLFPTDQPSDDLYDRLATEEPPHTGDDTTPSQTAPHRAINTGGGWMRYGIIGVMLIGLLVTVGVAVMVFAGDDEPASPASDGHTNANAHTDESMKAGEPETIITEAVLVVTEAATATDLPATVAPTLTPPPSATAILPTSTPLPTAAADEILVALQSPLEASDQAVHVPLRTSPYTITGSSGRTEVTTYTVKSGDTLSKIAESVGLDICTLVWSNPRSKTSPLMPGVLLDILPMDGLIYHVTRNMTIQEAAERTAVQPEVIINYEPNDLLDDTPETVLLEGMTLTVPGGSYGECIIWAPSAVAGADTPEGRVGSLRGCQYEVTNPGYPQLNPLPSGTYRFTGGFGSIHGGVDMAAKTGTPVFAAGSGTVQYAARNASGYSNTVVIDHGTGFYTLYAHLSVISVQCGQTVNQGDVIGAVGNEGRSSGPHLHFEIRNAGFTPVDPLSYIGL